MSQEAPRSAIVTGASRGIGKAIALRLAADGFAVTVNYAGSRAAAEAVAAQITAAGGRAIAVGADVSKTDEVARLFDESVRAWGRVDALVNNAGALLTKPVAEITDEEFDRLFAVNVRGTFLCCRQAARRMADGGRIVNLSSSTTAMMLPGYAAYCATKGAVEQLSHVLAKELGPRGITVNVVSPGPTDTELFGQGKTEEQKQFYARMAALGRLGTPEDIAGVVAALVGPDGRWVSGQNVRANGGLI
ncbi:3-oxoacyl-[acyl-carrier-protein] reductase FabG [Gemmata obscuriglobus]|uniref:KR domain-containing protein n=1 Tax=Gemmata obscuriglobus TaxID=114 RepID=A0A2Z3HIH9_9BACT|nr:SDR family oxidoreductase [Gemmata obscuriglobus]AWM41634.1 KR domain-containing protein [Gemmata obscuriglobus]QEG32437.1 3-oxoacyl-[acyl-carrier-protein] reductase FabG [Gemmata obscuriglobus]VTS11793.1 short chain dehydrogenase family protein : 3-oxoacyl-[acyl-carrier-protein] reductase protein OS=Rhodopirellula sp. SWK7 GN=RRSWK_05944 PE=3 SV=1: adh_short [Gemmata obscuriglobus UQM 2246]